MSSPINDLPPPWPNQALAQARKAHQIPLDPATAVPAVDSTDSSKVSGSMANQKEADHTKVDVKA